MYARTLLEEHNVVRLEAEKCVILEELLGVLACRATGHDVPRHDDGAGRLAMLLLRHALQACDALGLELEERFVRRKADVVAALGRGRAETRALAAGHEQHADGAVRDGGEARAAPLAHGVSACRRVARVFRQRLEYFLARAGLCRLFGGDGLCVDAVDAVDIERAQLRGECVTLGVVELRPEVE
jgi:hypothetical protein